MFVQTHLGYFVPEVYFRSMDTEELMYHRMRPWLSHTKKIKNKIIKRINQRQQNYHLLLNLSKPSIKFHQTGSFFWMIKARAWTANPIIEL